MPLLMTSVSAAASLTENSSTPPWKLVACMGVSQLVCWGTLHYLIALFAEPVAQEFGWTSARVQSGFSVATLVMAGSSYSVGRWIDQHGGRMAMMAGCWLGSLGCLLLSVVDSFTWYLAAWAVIGLGMRLALYDAAFATLAYVSGPRAKRAMSIVTIFGGLASTVFWPLGQHLLELYGWRVALQWYAGFLFACAVLHLSIPRASTPGEGPVSVEPRLSPVRLNRAVVLLYTYGAVGVLFLQTGMAAHFIGLLRAAGWIQGQAVWLATLLGIGQFSGRLVVALWAYRLNPVALNLLPASLQVCCFAAYLWSGHVLYGAMAFAFLYGAGNGLATYTRGAMPLVLFEPARYGRIVGLVLKPALGLAALAPIAFGFALEHWGGTELTTVALGLAISMAVAAVALYSIVLKT
jgi:MFS family permease